MWILLCAKHVIYYFHFPLFVSSWRSSWCLCTHVEVIHLHSIFRESRRWLIVLWNVKKKKQKKNQHACVDVCLEISSSACGSWMSHWHRFFFPLLCFNPHPLPLCCHGDHRHHWCKKKKVGWAQDEGKQTATLSLQHREMVKENRMKSCIFICLKKSTVWRGVSIWGSVQTYRSVRVHTWKEVERKREREGRREWDGRESEMAWERRREREMEGERKGQREREEGRRVNVQTPCQSQWMDYLLMPKNTALAVPYCTHRGLT